MTKELKAKDIILASIDTINEQMFKGVSVDSIASSIGVSYYSLYRYLNYYKYKELNNSLKEEEKNKLSSVCNNEDAKIGLVKDSLYKSCFEHIVDYKDCIVDKNGQEHYIMRQLVVPASIQAQRFYLINRKGNEWKNENSQLNLTAQDGSVKSINIAFNDNNDQPSKERIASIEQSLEANENKKTD